MGRQGGLGFGWCLESVVDGGVDQTPQPGYLAGVGGLIFVVMVETAQVTSSPISRKRRASSGVRHGVDSIAGRVHQEQDARCGA
jgi:hypothetical protein